MTDYKKQGKKNRQAGLRFENKVRKNLEEKGWIVSKWQNNVEWLEDNINRPPEEREGKLVPAKMGKFRSNQGGFPDFIAFFNEVNQLGGRIPFIDMEYLKSDNSSYMRTSLIGVEVKSNGYLDKEEKGKMDWLLQNHVFSKILVAMKDKNKRGGIIYKEYEKN